MRKEPPKSEGADERPFTPASAGHSLRERRRRESEGIRLQLERAALVAAGEVGYSSLSVKAMLDRAEVSRARFYSIFANKESCYTSAYEAAGERLARELLGAGEAAGDWVGGLRGGLKRLAGLIGEDPAWARGAIAEVHVAGGAAMRKRTEVFERLSRAVDRARRETGPSRHSPPPMTAFFIVSAIETVAIRSLARGEVETFAATVPDLVYLAASLYLGPGEALSAYRNARRAG
jgi:AcrR family transcriptional regulator